MKGLGIGILLSVTATAFAPSVQSRAVAEAETRKSVQDFAECFAGIQDRQSVPWAFAPGRHGGTFSNLGAKGTTKPYFIVISDRGTRRTLILNNVAAGSAAALGVSQCA